MDYSPSESSVHQERITKIRIQGTGAADPTVEVGQRITVKRISAGLYRVTWSDAPGTFVTSSHDFGAATTSDLKGYSVVRDTYDTTNLQLDYQVFNSSGTATDLAAAQYLDLEITFAATQSP